MNKLDMNMTCRKCKNFGSEICRACTDSRFLEYMYEEDCCFGDSCEDCGCCERADMEFDEENNLVG